MKKLLTLASLLLFQLVALADGETSYKGIYYRFFYTPGNAYEVYDVNSGIENAEIMEGFVSLSEYDTKRICGGAFARAYKCRTVNIPRYLHELQQLCFRYDRKPITSIEEVHLHERGSIKEAYESDLKYSVLFVSSEEKVEQMKGKRPYSLFADVVVEGTPTAFSVELETPGGLADKIGLDNLKHVIELKVKGDMNGDDFYYMQQLMPSLRYIDLREANIVAGGNYIQLEEGQVPNIFEQTQIKQFTFPNNAKNVPLFRNCYVLNKVDNLPAVSSFAREGFLSTVISEFSIPEGVKAVPNSFFKYCTKLSTLYLPSTLTGIADEAFYGSGLHTVYCAAVTPPYGKYMGKTSGATLYVPVGSKLKYMLAEGWKDFWKIEEYDFGNTGINNVNFDSNIEVARYNIDGEKVCDSYNGITIIKYADGRTKKVLNKKK